MNHIRLAVVLLSVCSLPVRAEPDTTSIGSMDILQWEKVATGVWKASIGKKELASMDYAGPPKLKALAEMGDTDFPFKPNETRSLDLSPPSDWRTQMPMVPSNRRKRC